MLTNTGHVRLDKNLEQKTITIKNITVMPKHTVLYLFTPIRWKYELFFLDY